MDQTSRRRRVVVTGMGAITPVGNTLEEYWQGLTAGRSGAAAITRFDATGYDTTFACEVKNFDPVAALGRRMANRTDLFSQFALVASDAGAEDEARAALDRAVALDTDGALREDLARLRERIDAMR